MLERLIQAGLNVARLNFSHGDFMQLWRSRWANFPRSPTRDRQTSVAIMADLPGPKMRLGKIDP